MNRILLVSATVLTVGLVATPLGPVDRARAQAADSPEARKVIVLGFDGLDYDLTAQLMEQGRMPNFQRLAATGEFAPLGTAVPPQSPVAWSNFITGQDSGGHGIFDFIHRDPATMIPYLSTTETSDAGKTIKLGKWQFPISGGSVELLRMGEAFWEKLDERGIESTIVRMPANFPPSGTATRELSGMGTPDVLGTYGTFSFYTTDTSPWEGETIGGGAVYDVRVIDDTIETSLYGPDNPFLVERTKTEAAFSVYVDPEEDAAKIVVGDEELVLNVGDWSPWIPVHFDLIPTQKLGGIALFYLKSVRPTFQLYVSPINFDPLSPAMPVSTPNSYAGELAKATGRYYTQGMPEDTRALSEGVLTRDEFLQQSKIAGDENKAQYRYVLDQFDEGLLFYYFGNVDQISHMTWRSLDPDHPAYDPEYDGPYADLIPGLYAELDEIVGYTLDRMDENTTLFVMSDHGFTSWRRSFHLNAWLRDNGYLAVRDPNQRNDPGYLINVDWTRTRAYGLGLNALYLNLRGRERYGIVNPGDREALAKELSEKLLGVIDPVTGEPAITKMYIREEEYDDRGHLEVGPDLLVGYAKMTRGSNQSALGEIPPEVITDNTSEWSGDHCMDHEAVPGILLTSRALKVPAPDLESLAAAILAELADTDMASR